jgi:hypothetical protein
MKNKEDCMTDSVQENIFTPQALEEIFPSHKADRFFEALFGDSSEGSFDIQFAFADCQGNVLEFEFRLTQRPGKCLACNLTYGLPQVFSRHPVIDVPGLVEQVARQVNASGVRDWKLGKTKEISPELHVIPLTIILDQE